MLVEMAIGDVSASFLWGQLNLRVKTFISIEKCGPENPRAASSSPFLVRLKY
jgi:hypothetical protein